ncbi:MAG: stage V sporulation protein AD [Clostridiales bacterium]|nr:stage V sporulation protein AD [Clostridiales bacterium]
MQNRVGARSVQFSSRPKLLSCASTVSRAEGEGPLGSCFDVILEDDKLGAGSFEQAELMMFENTVRLACAKVRLSPSDIGCLLAGDLLNQIITANYGARNLGMPFLGLYGACSTMSESLLIGGMLVDGGYLSPVACVSCSHFSTAERQYRFPLELGTTAPPTSQRTVTGAGCLLVGDALPETPMLSHCVITGATVGKVIDLGITDANNMGAAMAPAACDTIVTHFADTGRRPEDYDLIVTGDLGKFGTEMLHRLLQKQGLGLAGRHVDCGNLIYPPEPKYDCGGSGCGCSAVTLAGHLLPKLEAGELKRILFIATGALMSPTSSLQGESIPGIAHGVVLESNK